MSSRITWLSASSLARDAALPKGDMPRDMIGKLQASRLPLYVDLYLYM